MDINKILSMCDHTLLAQTATEAEIIALCREAAEFKTAAVCVAPCYVKLAFETLCGKSAVCTVVGFPNGNTTTASKCFETRDAIANGADEIDMVINIGKLREGNLKYVSEEIAAVKKECGNKILKVIIETCLLSDEEKKTMCALVASSGADYIKTSTGFSKGGATLADIKLFAENVPEGLKIKAAGGISSLEDASAFIEAGASRLGTSRLVKLAREFREGK
ncbi:MAG: deoxyribose-phosphate aldolase [Clostridia bacterium]|nr:deoxyribose-phosphate aldolase [Clostridia bacterium]